MTDVPSRMSSPAALDGEGLLAAWERGAAVPHAARATALLQAALPDTPWAEAAAMPVARRDRALLELHACSFGANLAAFIACPACGTRLEFTLPGAQAAAALDMAPVEETITRDGCTLRLRCAGSGDVAAAAALPDLATARDALAARCLDVRDRAGQALTFETLPDGLRAEVLTRLAALHDAAELSIGLLCPSCREHQTVLIDVPAFLWAELRHAALRLLDEVHELAAACAWSESAILAMSTSRRRAYLDRVRG